jgi:hypothetical protein
MTCLQAITLNEVGGDYLDLVTFSLALKLQPIEFPNWALPTSRFTLLSCPEQPIE